MVTGGFGNFKGVSVEQHNDCLVKLMEAVSSLLERRGLNVPVFRMRTLSFVCP